MIISRCKTISILIGLSISISAQAETYAAVDKNSCEKMINSQAPFILVLNKGDKLHESITNCANDANLKAASISGLGQVQDPVLAYFSSDPQEKPTLTQLEGFYELASLNGNITSNNGQHYTHIHGTLADQKFQGIAGHFESATVGLTVEITIVPFAGNVEREVDGKTGFGPIITR